MGLLLETPVVSPVDQIKEEVAHLVDLVTKANHLHLVHLRLLNLLKRVEALGSQEDLLEPLRHLLNRHLPLLEHHDLLKDLLLHLLLHSVVLEHLELLQVRLRLLLVPQPQLLQVLVPLLLLFLPQPSLNRLAPSVDSARQELLLLLPCLILLLVRQEIKVVRI